MKFQFFARIFFNILALGNCLGSTVFCLAQEKQRNEIVFVRVDKGKPALYTMQADGKSVMRISKGDRYVSDPSFSHDRKKVVYTILGEDKTWSLLTANTDGTGEKKLYQSGIHTQQISLDFPIFGAMWSADDLQIFF